MREIYLNFIQSGLILGLHIGLQFLVLPSLTQKAFETPCLAVTKEMPY